MRRSGGVFVVLLAVVGPLLAQETVPAPSATQGPILSTRDPAGDPTVSAPPSVAAPAAGSVRLRRGVVPGKPVSLTRGAASTVTGYEKGKSLTVRTPAGTIVKFRVAKGASVPDDLAAGRTVLVETTVVKKRRWASRVIYAESRVVMTNVDEPPAR